MHERTPLVICSFASLLFISCTNKNNQDELSVSSCTGYIISEGYKKLSIQDIDYLKKSINSIKKSKDYGLKMDFNRYCASIKYKSNQYCILYILKDDSIGGDITICHDKKNNNILRTSFGE
jgi:hypothetical protein